MKWSTWILFVLSLSVLVAASWMVTRQSKRTPSDFFADIEKRVEAGAYDREQAVLNLDQVLEEANDAGDTELATRVQLRRGRLLMEIGSFERARADLAAVAVMHPSDVAVQNDLVELEARSGNFRGARDRVTQLLERDPRSSGARVTLGRLHRSAGDRSVALAADTVSRVLTPEELIEMRALLSRSSALDPSDPRRVALAHDIRDRIPSSDESLAEAALVSVDQACKDFAAARAAFADALQYGREPEAIAGLIDLFERAGQNGLAVDLATSTIRLPELSQNEEFARTLMRALETLGRQRYAADVATAWTKNPRGITSDFAEECCIALWLGRSYQQLWRASNLLAERGSSTQVMNANLYRGLAFVEQGAWNDGRLYLVLFIKSELPEPFPGALSTAWSTLARAYRKLGDAINERQALEEFVRLRPDADGEAWLRLAELQTSQVNAGRRAPERRFAIGMSLLPARTAELLPRWHELGALELRSIGLDLEAARTDLQHGKVWTPAPDAEPYEYYRLAQMHAEENDWLVAAARVRKVLDLVPGFVPAIDLAIEIQGALGKERERMQLLVERIRRAGRTPAIDVLLRAIPLSELRSQDLLALMRADPDRTGRLILAEDFARQGRPDDALELIRTLPAEQLGDEGRLLLARAHLGRFEPVRALSVIAPMREAVYPVPQGIETLIRAAAGAGDRPRLEALARSLGEHLAPKPLPGERTGETPWFLTRARALQLVDQFLSVGHGEAAFALLKALDANPKMRGGDVAVRLVSCAVLRGDLDAAHEALDRALAFDTRGEGEYVALLLAAHEGRLGELRGLAGAASSAGFPGTPLLQAQLALIRGNAEDVRAIMTPSVRERFDQDAWWNLTLLFGGRLDTKAANVKFSPYMGTLATEDARAWLATARTPEEVQRLLVRLGAATTPLGAPFVHAWLADLPAEESARLWPEWLRANLQVGAGLGNLASEALQRIRTLAPDFGPGWDLEERVNGAKLRAPRERIAFRARRATALGVLAGTELRRNLDVARARIEEGRLPEALEAAKAAQTADPRSMEAIVVLAAAQRSAGQERAALATLQRVLAKRGDGPVVARPPQGAPGAPDFVAEYLSTLERARESTAAPIGRDRVQALVSDLLNEWPDDPRVIVAQAELDLDDDPLNPALGVSRAYARLDRFRAQHPGVPLEKLGAGAMRAWARFYTRLDPGRAVKVLEDELALEPQRLETWQEYARALDQAGKPDEARKQLEYAVRISPSGGLLREILRMRSEAELPPERIEASAQEILAAEGRTEGDAELGLLLARSYMNRGPRHLDHALLLLEGLDQWRTMSRSFQIEHTLLSATALLTSGRPEHRARARTLLEASEPLLVEPYPAVFARAMKGLARDP